jgi:DNA (cytosine-5)-methyltransferase 1
MPSLFGRMDGPAVADLFAGGGGASEGIRRATGFHPTVAINHCADAIRMHAANHPETMHFLEDVFEVPPGLGSRGRTLDLLWASPQCTHFSRARGGAPKSDQQRSLAWVVVDWARAVRPRTIIVENVPEFVTWGPLADDGEPVRARAGETFRAWVGALEAEGYVVEHRVLMAADYGAPTSRRRVYVDATRGRRPVWPTRWPPSRPPASVRS